jgi:hypothetical protein
MKIAVFWDVTPCRPTIRRTLLPSSLGYNMEAARSSETLLNIYQIKRRHISEERNIHKKILMGTIPKT